MSENALDDAAIDRRLTESGLDPATVRKAAEAPAIRAQLDDTRKLAKALNIQGTPAFIIGDTMIPGADVEAIRVAITQAKAKNLKTLG
jgi:protein-disulfide isomerase